MEAINNSNRGYFITIEGVEGVGKTTNIEAIEKFLQQHGIPFVNTREPGGTQLAEDIRALVLKEQSPGVDAITELLLIFAARSHHLQHVILPALNRGDWVICDRFTDATYAYQGGGRGIDCEQIAILENLVQGELRPDLTLLLDLDPRLGLQRALNRGDLDRFEKEQVDFFDAVREVYLQRAAAEEDRYTIIDAGQSLELVTAATLSVLRKFLDAKCG